MTELAKILLLSDLIFTLLNRICVFNGIWNFANLSPLWKLCLFGKDFALSIRNMIHLDYYFKAMKGASWSWSLDLQLPVQSMPITTKVVSSKPRSWRGVLDTTLYDKVCQWLATGLWFSAGTPVFSTNKTDRHDITENQSMVI